MEKCEFMARTKKHALNTTKTAHDWPSWGQSKSKPEENIRISTAVHRFMNF